MDTRAAIKSSMNLSHMVCSSYLEDLTDEEMLHRPHAKSNHIKWQVGHLIASEHQLVEAALPGSMPKLPDGFVERYTKETASSDDPAQFDTKADLLALAAEQRTGTLAALDKHTDEDFDKPSPEAVQSYAPTIGDIFCLQASHWMMHSGQWAVVRRQLGRPPLF